MKNSDKSIVILSGGMDSVTTLAYASNKGFKNYCITFNYGQKVILKLILLNITQIITTA